MSRSKTKWDKVESAKGSELRRPRDLAAGHERDESARRVKDQLDEEAEVLEKETQVFALDPSKIRPDREIIQVLPSQGVSGALPDYNYAWIRFKSDRGPSGLAVDQKLFWQVKDESGDYVPVWEVVSGTMPEARERRNAEGYRVIGDTLLMRARKDRYEALMLHFEFEHEKRIGTEATTIQEFCEQKDIKLHKFDGKRGLDERGMLAAKSAVSNMKRNFKLDLSAANAIIKEAESKGDAKLPLLRLGLKQMLGMQIAQQYVEKRMREGTLILKGD